MVDDGFLYLLLAPLSVGRHELEFGGTFDGLGFSIDTRYEINVVSARSLKKDKSKKSKRDR